MGDVSTPDEAHRFSIVLLDLVTLVHELISICYENGHRDINPFLIQLAGGYLSGTDKILAIEKFIQYSHMFWHQVKERNEKFFLENAAEIFKFMPIDNISDKVSAFRILFTAQNPDGTKLIEKEDRDAMFDYFESLVKISIKYVHSGRCPSYKQEEAGVKRVYMKNFLPDVKLQAQAKLFNMELQWPDI